MSQIVRQCIACRRRLPRTRMLRIVRTATQPLTFVLDLAYRVDGRGCYICSDPGCRAKLRKQKLLDRAFRTAVPDKIYREIDAANGQ